MQIFIKVAPRDYQRLRSQIARESPAYEAIEKASRIDHSVEGVMFEGYSIPCNDEQVRVIMEVARKCCPEVIPDIEKAMQVARPG